MVLNTNWIYLLSILIFILSLLNFIKLIACCIGQFSLARNIIIISGTYNLLFQLNNWNCLFPIALLRIKGICLCVDIIDIIVIIAVIIIIDIIVLISYLTIIIIAVQIIFITITLLGSDVVTVNDI